MRMIIVRSLLKGSYVLAAMTVVVGVVINIPLTWYSAPYVFAGVSGLSFFGEWFEKSFFDRLKAFKVADVYAERERLGLNRRVEQFRADGLGLLLASITCKLLLGGIAALLINQSAHVDVGVFIVCGYAIMAGAILIGIAQANLWSDFEKFYRNHNDQADRRKRTQATLLELQASH